MDNQILINFTGLDGTASPMTGSGDSDTTPRTQHMTSQQRASRQPKSKQPTSRLLTSTGVDLPEPEPEPEPTPLYQRQKLPKRASSAGPLTKGERQRATRGDGVKSPTSPTSPIPPTHVVEKESQTVEAKEESSETDDSDSDSGRDSATAHPPSPSPPVVEKESHTAEEESSETDDSDSEADIAVDVEEDDSRRHLNRRLSSHSYRSLSCPHGDCRRTVAASGFLAHFRYEHRSVARARLSPHHAVDFALSPHCLHPYLPIALCILQVNISGQFEELAIYSPGEGHPAEEKGRGAAEVVTCALLGRVATLDDGEGGVALAIWCACLFEPHERPPIAYKLRATLQGRRQLRVDAVYRGPVDSMRCANSGGLLLPPPRQTDDDADPTIALRLRFHRLVPRHTTSPATAKQ